MAFRGITPPEGALAGKTYCVCDITGLLLMEDPTISDIVACRGIYIHYTMNGYDNRMLLAGRAFDEYLRLIHNLWEPLTNVSTAPTLAYKLVNRVLNASYYLVSQPKPCNGRTTAGYGNLTLAASQPTCSVVGVYAVPHTLLSAHWSTWGSNCSRSALMIGQTSLIPANNGNVGLGSSTPNQLVYGNTDCLQLSATGHSAYIASPNYQREYALPTYAAAGKSTITYRQAVVKLVNALDLGDASGVKQLLADTVCQEIVARGVSLDQAVVVPIIFGGYADSLRLLGDSSSWGSGVAHVRYGNPTPWYTTGSTTNAEFRNTSVVHAGGLVPIGNAGYRLPIPLLGDVVNVESPTNEARVYQLGPHSPWLKWSSASHAMCALINGRPTLELLGSQPFAAYYNDDMTAKTLPDHDFDLKARLELINGYSRQFDVVDPTAGYQEGSQTIESQQQAYVAGVGDADPSSMEIATIGDTMAITMRALIAAVYDGVRISGSDAVVSAANIKRVFECYSLATNSSFTE